MKDELKVLLNLEGLGQFQNKTLSQKITEKRQENILKIARVIESD